MTGVRPDVTKLGLYDNASPSTSTSPSRLGSRRPSAAEGPQSAGGPAVGPWPHSNSSSRAQSPELGPNEPGPHWRVRNSTLGEQYAAAKGGRAPDARAAGDARQPSTQQSGAENQSEQRAARGEPQFSQQHQQQPQQQQQHHQQLHQQSQQHSPQLQPPQQPAAQQHQHLKPADSSASVSSMASQRSGKLSRGTPSVVELKRFFGKGRTKHDKPDNTDGAKKSAKKTGLFGSLFRHKARHDKPKAAAQFDLHGDSSPKQTSSSAASSNVASDPNFVVSAPGEEEWDPFHVLGLGESGDGGEFGERMPFLESEITKYGEMGKDMGSGAGGNVRMMERPSDHKLFAVKEFRARKPNETVQKYAKHVTTEYALGAAFHHEHVIETIDLIKEGDKYFEVMEYGPHDFFALVMSSAMTTPQIDSSFHQIVSGVHYLHSMGVAHRDLKLDNCVVTKNGVVKLIDFGSAVVFKYPMSPQIHLARGIMGSDPYLAPEVFERRPYQPQCADIWSCGIIYCCIYLRRFPWKLPQHDDPSFRKFAEVPANVDGHYSHTSNPRKILGPWRLLRLLPAPSRHIIGRVLTVKVDARATMDEVLKDGWFSHIAEISVLHSTDNIVSAPDVTSEVAAHA